MGPQKSSTWEFRLRMVQLLEKGEQNPSRISRGHHVTRSLLYYWWQLYREQGEAAFHPTKELLSPPQIERPQTTQDQVAQLERLCGQQALEIDLLKRAWHLLPSRTDTL